MHNKQATNNIRTIQKVLIERQKTIQKVLIEHSKSPNRKTFKTLHPSKTMACEVLQNQSVSIW